MKPQTVLLPLPGDAHVPARLHSLFQAIMNAHKLVEHRGLSTIVCHPKGASDGWVVRCTIDTSWDGKDQKRP